MDGRQSQRVTESTKLEDGLIRQRQCHVESKPEEQPHFFPNSHLVTSWVCSLSHASACAGSVPIRANGNKLQVKVALRLLPQNVPWLLESASLLSARGGWLLGVPCSQAWELCRFSEAN
jgi:hypothetical protein